MKPTLRKECGLGQHIINWILANDLSYREFFTDKFHHPVYYDIDIGFYESFHAMRKNYA